MLLLGKKKGLIVIGFHRNELEREKKSKPSVYRKKKIIKTKAKINEINQRQGIEKKITTPKFGSLKRYQLINLKQDC